MAHIPKNILFVCSANKDRSKTADDYFSSIYSELNFNSAGTNLKLCQKEGTNPLSEDLINWADLIFVMEKKHLEKVNSFPHSSNMRKVVILHIADRYKYYNRDLIEI